MRANTIINRITTLRQRKLETATAAELEKQAKEAVLEALESEPGKTFTFQLDDNTTTATVVEGTTVQLDHEALKKALGEKLWGKVTTPVLDRDLLEDAIKRGLVSADTVSSCSTLREKAPYVKLTESTVKAKKTAKQKTATKVAKVKPGVQDRAR